MEEDFDLEELESFIQRGLKAAKASEVDEARDLLSYGDVTLLHRLEPILRPHLNATQLQKVLDDLRIDLLSGDRGHVNRTKALRELHRIVKNCRRCPEVQPEPHLPHWNLIDPDVAFVFDSPLRPTDGGTLFIDTLKDVGFRSSDVIATSVTRCLTPGRAPNEQEIQKCASHFLFRELQLLRPKLVVALGGIATTVLTGSELKITEERGTIFWIGPWPLLATYSPAYAQRSGYNTDDFRNDISTAYRFVYDDEE